MRQPLVMAIAAAMLAACSHAATVSWDTKAEDYQWHKQTNYIKVHWNYVQPDSRTLIAEGFVEPFDPADGVFMVRLRLVGLDDKSNIVSSADGMPKDDDIISPMTAKSPFRIELKTTGREAEFTVTGSYYHYLSGERPVLESGFLDYIPLKSDETD